MKVLVLTFYYSPDLCAGSFRTTALIDELKKTEGIEIEVITTMPNRYSSFETKALEYEKKDNVTIRRISLPSHKSGMLDQIKSFYAFYKQAKNFVKNEHYDLVFATSSRLFTAFLGSTIAKKKKLPLYLDIRDIFVDTIKDVLNPKIAFIMKPLLTIVEKYTFSNANHINLVSKGFEGYFSTRYPKPEYSFFTNGIDKEFLNFKRKGLVKSKVNETSIILYAGNIGEGQGLNTILPELARLAGSKYHFKVIGDGGRKNLLVESCKDIENLSFHPPVSREELLNEYEQADILFLHLNDYPAFEKVLPSKVFEYAATGKPILAGVNGYAAKFTTEEVKNAGVFYPGDHVAAFKCLNNLSLEYSDRENFITKYTRSNIMKKLSYSITAIVGDA